MKSDIAINDMEIRHAETALSDVDEYPLKLQSQSGRVVSNRKKGSSKLM
jgi:hypothetical protein